MLLRHIIQDDARRADNSWRCAIYCSSVCDNEMLRDHNNNGQINALSELDKAYWNVYNIHICPYVCPLIYLYVNEYLLWMCYKDKMMLQGQRYLPTMNWSSNPSRTSGLSQAWGEPCYGSWVRVWLSDSQHCSSRCCHWQPVRLLTKLCWCSNYCLSWNGNTRPWTRQMSWVFICPRNKTWIFICPRNKYIEYME